MKSLLYLLYMYFKEKRFEASGRVYKTMGVHHFKKIVPFGDYFFRFVRLFNKKFRILRIRSTEIKSLIFFTLMIETIHVLGFIAMNIILFRNYDRTGQFSFKIIILNMLINVMPILVQRYNRIRLLRISLTDFKKYMLPR